MCSSKPSTIELHPAPLLCLQRVVDHQKTEMSVEAPHWKSTAGIYTEVGTAILVVGSLAIMELADPRSHNRCTQWPTLRLGP